MIDSLPNYDAWKTTPPEDPDRDLCNACDGLGDTCTWCGKPSWAKLGLEGPCEGTCECRTHDPEDNLNQAELLDATKEWSERFGPCTTCAGEGSVEPDPADYIIDPYI